MKVSLMVSLMMVALRATAYADIVTFAFTGTVQQVPVDEQFLGIQFGDQIHGSYTFDTSVLDTAAGGSEGSYTSNGPLFGMTATIASHVFTTTGLLNVGIFNAAVDQYTVLSTEGDLTLELFLQDNTASVFSNDTLPLLPPDLADFIIRDFHLQLFDAGQVQVDGSVESLTCVAGCAVVPEPSSWLFLSTALVFLTAKVHKRLNVRRRE